ncbi:MAG: hypothetical protein CME18_08625 [Gemmatimonadetes bacterium]|nr:hypothetical protein [Gemmatimonadota bacterium]|tara:strand:+ start:19398 stop:19733 length:336 start_codon:yes stop_codon:yes gene_type:complete
MSDYIEGLEWDGESTLPVSQMSDTSSTVAITSAKCLARCPFSDRGRSMQYVPQVEFLRRGELLARLGISRKTLYIWVRDGFFPKPIKRGAVQLWTEGDLAEWAQSARGSDE